MTTFPAPGSDADHRDQQYTRSPNSYWYATVRSKLRYMTFYYARHRSPMAQLPYSSHHICNWRAEASPPISRLSSIQIPKWPSKWSKYHALFKHDVMYLYVRLANVQ